MADIVKRSDYPMTTQGWDPFRTMREMLRLDPLLREPFFREAAPWFTRNERDVWMPMIEVRENGNSLKVIIDVPGVKRDDLEINVVGNMLTITGKREAEERNKDEQFHSYERSYGQFVRSLTLPDYTDLDHITSSLQDGVLTVVVPKTTQSKSRKIQIGSGTGKH